MQWTGGGSVTPMLLQAEPPELKAAPEKVQMMTAMWRTPEIVNKAKDLGFEIFEDNCCECGHIVVYTEATVETLSQSPETLIIL